MKEDSFKTDKVESLPKFLENLTGYPQAVFVSLEALSKVLHLCHQFPLSTISLLYPTV
jgi:hypothetical protein